MKTEKGVVIVAYKELRRNRRYLVLKRTKNWEGWELPKGHLEDGDHEKTAIQEMKEEAGLKEEDIIEIEEMDETLEWSFEEEGEEIERKYSAFTAKIDGSAVVDVSENPHEEHGNGFFLNYEDASSLLTYENQAELLEKVKESTR